MTVQKRPDDNIFASSAKSGEIENFPDLARGWGIAFEQTEGKPPMEWFNWLFKRQDEAIRYMLQQGLPEWSPTEDYPIHAFTKQGAKVYRAIEENKGKDPSKNAIIWKEWGLDADLVLLKENNLSEIKEKGKEAQKTARENIGAISADEIPDVNLDDYVPNTRKINGKELKTDIDLTAADVKAAESTHNHDTVYAQKSHTHSIAQVSGLETALAGKAIANHGHTDLSKTDASNITVDKYLQKLGLKEVSLTANGWVKLPNGLIIQWGSLEIPADSRTTINFPVSFAKYVFSAQVTSDRNYISTGGTALAASTVQNLTLTSMQITNDNGISKHYWIALGF